MWKPVDQVLAALKVAPDFEPADYKVTEKELVWSHRSADGADVYFVANQTDQPQLLNLDFRVDGRQPELWDPQHGTMEKTVFWRPLEDGRTRVSMAFEPAQSFFVVFRQPVANADPVVSFKLDGKDPRLPVVKEKPVLDVESAIYGIEEQADKTVDVTAKIRQIVAGGETRIFVHPKTFGIPDPAPSEPKALKVVFKLNGAAVERAQTDLKHMGVPDAAAEGWQVVSAVYGIQGDPGRTVDVSAAIRKALADGKPDVRVFPTDLGVADPASRERKTLRILLSDGTRTETLEAPDMQRLAFPAKPNAAAGDTAAATVEEDNGRLLLNAPANGHYEVATLGGTTANIQVSGVPKPVDLSNDWQLSFPAQKPYTTALPSATRLPSLISWSKHADEKIRFFSGTAVYEKTVTLSPEQLADGMETVLDLGDVGVMAEVIINGKPVGSLWKAPYRLNVTEYLKPGANVLQIEVTNLWCNRLIGDAAKPSPLKWGSRNEPGEWPDWMQNGPVPDTGRTTFCTWNFYKSGDALMPSGIIGPAGIHFMKKTPLEFQEAH